MGSTSSYCNRHQVAIRRCVHASWLGLCSSQSNLYLQDCCLGLWLLLHGFVNFIQALCVTGCKKTGMGMQQQHACL